MIMLLECSSGPWNADHRRGCKNIRGGRAGYRQSIACTDGLHNEGEDEANAALIAAAHDHALIWWASEYSDDFDIIKEVGADRFVLLGGTGQNTATVDPSGRLSGPALAIDTFGFPILTDNLRARLIAEMESGDTS